MGKPLSAYKDAAWKNSGAGNNKLNKVLGEMSEGDREVCLTWLRDESGWTDTAIAAAIQDWADENGNSHMRVSHGVVARWRRENK